MEDGSTIGNALKTMFTRISKVAAMPSYEDEIDNEAVSKAAAALHEIGIEVYNTDGSFRNITETLTQLNDKWDGLTDAQKSYISYQVAATRQSSKFKSMLQAFSSSMELATEATNAQGNSMENQSKYNESFVGQMQSIRTQMDTFWLKLLNSDATHGILTFLDKLAEGFNNLADVISPIGALIAGLASSASALTAGKMGFQKLIGGGRAKSL